MIRTLSFSFLLAVVTMASFHVPAVHAGQPRTVVLDVRGMTCGTCPITVRLALKRVPGVIDAKADLDTRTATVTYDPDRTTVQALTRATSDAGYPSTVRANAWKE